MDGTPDDTHEPDVWDPGERVDHDRAVARLLVVAQMVLVGAVVAAAWAHGPGRLATSGLVVSAAGAGVVGWAGVALGRGLTASPVPNGRVELRRAGPYRLVRHPMYSGLLLGALGAVVWSGGWLTAIAWGLLALLLRIKAGWEEGHLVAVFPGYPEYAITTPRFVPSLRK